MKDIGNCVMWVCTTVVVIAGMIITGSHWCLLGMLIPLADGKEE